MFMGFKTFFLSSQNFFYLLTIATNLKKFITTEVACWQKVKCNSSLSKHLILSQNNTNMMKLHHKVLDLRRGTRHIKFILVHYQPYWLVRSPFSKWFSLSSFIWLANYDELPNNDHDLDESTPSSHTCENRCLESLQIMPSVLSLPKLLQDCYY